MNAPASHGFQPGQRWISTSEPELGLGEVHSVSGRTVTLDFRASGQRRQYVALNAPLRRAAFRAGDSIRTRGGDALTVIETIEEDGRLAYRCGERLVPETELHDALSFSRPLERLFAAHFDPSPLFDLRAAALGHQQRRLSSPVHGFLGGRIDLLPHQLSIAADVTGRLAPRVLLADEVGLGKTIEACLILHRLVLTGRVSRALIVVPDTLVHQWFLELLRRFNLWFHIYTEGRCVAIEESNAAANPFLESQLVLADLGLFLDNPLRLEQALAAGWDLLIVDEAHHLQWSPEASTPAYDAIERIGRQTPGLLLLTATPEQLGIASHFARLRLLDPDRFHDLDAFLRETAEYVDVARQAAAERSLRPREWFEALLDQHGTGRVMFRNTRATVSGFPRRVACLHPLDVADNDSARLRALDQEWLADHDRTADDGWRPHFGRDPRLEWLAALLRTTSDKILLICRSPRKALAIEAALRRLTTLPFGVFHEGMTLIQRDRAAAWFAEPDGARLLICSEIGSEGRNFQFAHHLVLFDLPLDPGLLEQRIGRLDRIGQRSEIAVHVPFVRRTHQEVLARWYHEGLDAFAANTAGGRELMEQFVPSIRALAERGPKRRSAGDDELTALVADTVAARREVSARLERGRDQLLEWNSFKPEVAASVLSAMREADEDTTLDEFMLQVFDHYFIEVEELAPRTYRLGSAGVLRDAFPGLTSDSVSVTASRQRALVREEQQFLTWDHPLVSGALDVLLGSEHGNCSVARWIAPGPTELFVEAIYLLECVAPAALNAGRFLPPTPVRVVCNHRGEDAGTTGMPLAAASLDHVQDAAALLKRADIRETLLPRLVERTRLLAERRVPALVHDAQQAIAAHLGRELARLQQLRKVNRSVREAEIVLMEQLQKDLQTAVGGARLRLDAIRVIYRAPAREARGPA